MAEEVQEKRTYRRAETLCRVDITNEAGDRLVGHLLDLSLDAMHFATESPWDEDTPLSFSIRPTGAESPVKTEMEGTGKVVRVSDGGMVIEFLTWNGVAYDSFCNFLKFYIEKDMEA